MGAVVAACVRVQALLALVWFRFASRGGFSRNFQLAVKAVHSQLNLVAKSLSDSPLSKKASRDSFLWCGSFQRQSPIPWSLAGHAPVRLEVRILYFFGRSQLLTWTLTSRNKHLYWSVYKAHSCDIKLSAFQLIGLTKRNIYNSPVKHRDGSWHRGVPPEQHHIAQPDRVAMGLVRA